MSMDEVKLVEKLRLIEALFAGTNHAGEREAAAEARGRVAARLEALRGSDPLTEYRFSLGDVWSRRLFTALLRRYGVAPYRYPYQRRTTVMARLSRRFVDEVLWPQFQQLDTELRRYLNESTERIISQVVGADSSEATEIEEPKGLGAGAGRPQA